MKQPTFPSIEQHRIDQALDNSEHLFRRLADSMPHLVWIADNQGLVTYYNSQSSRYSGITHNAEDLTWNWQPLLHADDIQPTLAAWNQAVALGQTYECEHRVLMLDGQYRWHLSRAIPAEDGPSRQWFGTATDIHDIKLAEQTAREHHVALQQSEQRFRAAIDAAGGLLWTNSSEGLMKGEQPGWAKFTGQSYDEYQDYGWADAVHPDDAQVTVEAWNEAVVQQKTFIFEHRVRRYDGVYRLFAIRAVPVIDDNGRIREWVGVHTDITEQRQAESALRESEQSFRLLADTMPQIVWSTRPDGYHDYFNERWYEYTGMPRPDEPGGEYDPHETGQGWNWKAYLHPDDYDRSVATWSHCLATGELYTIEYRFKRTDGVYRWFIGRALPLRDAHGNITRWFGTCTDVDDVKAAERALRESEERFRNMANTAPAMLWITDENHQCTFLSKAWQDYTGQTPEVGFGLGWTEVIHPDDRNRAANVYMQSAQRKQPFDFDYRLKTVSGEYRWAVDTARPRFDHEGNFCGFIGAVFDVHERKLAEDALRDADRRKDEFLATLAHELRNPLAPIRSATELLKLISISDPVVEEVRQTIDRQVAHMVHLVDDLLDISRITSGKLQLRKEPVTLQEVIQSAVEASYPIIKAGEHQLVVQIPEERVPLLADSVRLSQVFTNLLTNAAKYSDVSGSISLVCVRDAQQVIVTVQDRGIGIPPEHLPQLFQMFSQVQSAIDRSQGGLGIGLSLVRGLVEMHGGSVQAYSDGIGQGSRFTVHLPIHSASSPKANESPVEQKPKPGLGTTTCRILVVDDSPTIVRMLSMLLSAKGHIVHTASDGQDALHAMDQGVFDLILMDIGMPHMNGYEAARLARAKGITTPMIALTGFGREEDKQAATAAGFNDHLVKPISAKSLDNLFAQNVRIEPRYHPANPTHPAKMPPQGLEP